MIERIWHGWTTPENADTYEALLKTTIFPGIAAKKIKGYRSIELLRRPVGEEVEFITVMRFDSLDDIKAFTGADYETAYVIEAAQKVLKRYDQRAQHYELRDQRTY